MPSALVKQASVLMRTMWELASTEQPGDLEESDLCCSMLKHKKSNTWGKLHGAHSTKRLLTFFFLWKREALLPVAFLYRIIPIKSLCGEAACVSCGLLLYTASLSQSSLSSVAPAMHVLCEIGFIQRSAAKWAGRSWHLAHAKPIIVRLYLFLFGDLQLALRVLGFLLFSSLHVSVNVSKLFVCQHISYLLQMTWTDYLSNYLPTKYMQNPHRWCRIQQLLMATWSMNIFHKKLVTKQVTAMYCRIKLPV